MDDRLKLPGEEELPRLRPLQLRPVVRQEVIRAAPAPEQHHYYDNEDNWVDNGDRGKVFLQTMSLILVVMKITRMRKTISREAFGSHWA